MKSIEDLRAAIRAEGFTSRRRELMDVLTQLQTALSALATEATRQSLRDVNGAWVVALRTFETRKEK